MQKTADGLKEGVQKAVFLNVSGIGRAPTSLIVFFSKTGKSVRAGTKRPQMLRKSRFNMSQPSFSTPMFLRARPFRNVPKYAHQRWFFPPFGEITTNFAVIILMKYFFKSSGNL